MPINSNFNFTNNSVVTLELPFSEHVEELRQRIFLIVGLLILVYLTNLFINAFILRFLKVSWETSNLLDLHASPLSLSWWQPVSRGHLSMPMTVWFGHPNPFFL